MAGPLQGIKVVDASAVVSGPLAAMMLADQGADVIKIEPPAGEVLRLPNLERGGLSSFFLNCNRNKRGIVVDATQEEGREIIYKLIDDADVFIQNWRPGAAERNGLGEADLRKRNPNLIYCSISGFGPTGPYSQRRVYDPIIQGLSGHTGVQESPELPIRDLVRNIVADKSSAYTAAQAITAALFARERGAGGQLIEVPMLDASLAFFWPDGMLRHTFHDGADIPGFALYETYRLWHTKDGQIIYFAASQDEHEGLFKALDHPEWLEDPRFGTVEGRADAANREALGALVEDALRQFTTADLLDRLVSNDVPAGPVLELDEVFDDPQVQHNGAVLEFEHPTAGKYRQAGPAARFHGTPQDPRRHLPPLHGEHTAEVLAELGYSAEELARLREQGVVPG
ncbi:MAG: CoA transferase [Pseudomonadota bacterium]